VLIQAPVGHSELGLTQTLSGREIEVMRSIAKGISIGSLLGVATKTVDNHRSRLMQKAGVYNAASLTLAAFRMGICPGLSVPVSVIKSL
jgi:DNA-binding NarL/FixJ family response regulator